MTEPKTPVIRLLDLVWENANKATDHSWQRLNHSMSQCLKLAIGAGFEFSEADMAYILASYRASYWIGTPYEWVYALAITVGNLSAAKSFEAHHGREPFIADDVEIENAARQRERLAVGFKFPWKGREVEVTSFAADCKSLTACSYKPNKKGEYGRRIDKRFRITRDDIIDDRAERKERAELLAKLTAAASANGNAKAITKALGAKTRAELDAVPLAKIREVAAKYAAQESGAA